MPALPSSPLTAHPYSLVGLAGCILLFVLVTVIYWVRSCLCRKISARVSDTEKAGEASAVFVAVKVEAASNAQNPAADVLVAARTMLLNMQKQAATKNHLISLHKVLMAVEATSKPVFNADVPFVSVLAPGVRMLIKSQHVPGRFAARQPHARPGPSPLRAVFIASDPVLIVAFAPVVIATPNSSGVLKPILDTECDTDSGSDYSDHDGDGDSEDNGFDDSFLSITSMSIASIPTASIPVAEPAFLRSQLLANVQRAARVKRPAAKPSVRSPITKRCDIRRADKENSPTCMVT
ncbi:hypothetical protein C8R44DRAFT_856096 [Mycena epipterygia]|nr:hypothetical protein C8R44DRAFT_856096 [Mycena epipterygia]